MNDRLGLASLPDILQFILTSINGTSSLFSSILSRNEYYVDTAFSGHCFSLLRGLTKAAAKSGGSFVAGAPPDDRNGAADKVTAS